jgi:hypothetical protein
MTSRWVATPLPPAVRCWVLSEQPEQHLLVGRVCLADILAVIAMARTMSCICPSKGALLPAILVDLTGGHF